jgi:polyisoprenyl-teichoic acid--peptidoglycan teichoic acid transferase
VATFLSFLWPGLGHWYLHRPRAAALYALPVLAVLLVVAWELATAGPARFAIDLFSPSFSSTAIILIVLLGLWRLLAMVDALTIAGGRGAWRSSRLGGGLGALAIVAVVVHGIAGYYAWSFYDAGSAIFVDPGPDATLPVYSPGSTSLGQELQATPITTPASASSRINILLTGIDSSAGRNHALNDTIIVVSVDPANRTAAMLSIPRDVANFPLWDGRIYHNKINSLMTAARDHGAYPDGPINTLAKEVGFLVGLPIHYYAAIDLSGFVEMIDKVGGVDIVNPQLIDDPNYGGWTDGRPIGFRLTPGPHHLGAQEAMAYVRSRKGLNDNDFNRARRQQQLLVALEKKMTDPQMLPRLPGLLSAAKHALVTDFPADRLSEMLDLGREIDLSTIKQTVLGPSKYATQPPLSATGGVYELQLDLKAVAELSIKWFGADSLYYTSASAPAASGAP